MNRQIEKKEKVGLPGQVEAPADKTRSAQDFTKIAFNKETLERAKSFLASKGFSHNWLERLFSDERLERLKYPAPLMEEERRKVKKPKSKEEKEAEYQLYKKAHDFWVLLQAGKMTLALYKEAFEKAERETGVPREFIAAILGIESKYGMVKPKYPVFNLYLTYVENRPDKIEFALNELAAFLQICRKYGVDPFSVNGSSAGALLPGQFLPSTLRQLDDLPKGASFEELGSLTKSIDMVARFLAKAGASSREGFDIGGKNWKAAWRYNHDDNYARFVMELAKELK